MNRIMLRSLITIVLVFSIAFGIKKAIAQDTPIFACSKEQASALRGRAINCSAVNDVLDAIQAQHDFVIMNRLSWETETVCGKAYALARKLHEEDRPALRKKAPELLEKCSEAILAEKK
jgi:hypothetical protein